MNGSALFALWSLKDVSYLFSIQELPWFYREPYVFRILQPVWDALLLWEEYIRSPLFPVIASILLYFLCVTPWVVVDLWGKDWKWIQKYKIQPDKEVT